MGGTTSRANMTPQQELQKCMIQCRDISLNKAEARQRQINKKRIEQHAANLARREGAEYQQKRNREKAERAQGIDVGIARAAASAGGALKKRSRRSTKRRSVKRKNSLKKSLKKRRNRKIRRYKKK